MFAYPLDYFYDLFCKKELKLKMIDPQKQSFIEGCEQIHGPNANLNRTQIVDISKTLNIPFPYWFVTSQFKHPQIRGIWIVPSITDEKATSTDDVSDASRAELNELATLFQAPTNNVPSVSSRAPVSMPDDDINLIPEVFYGYIPFGFFGKLKQIIESKRFFPAFIAGDSGEGKTLMIQQVCAILGRECILASISIETDQNDLLGGPTLLNGNVIDREGPVILAMRRGAVLVLDEVDRGSNKLICLHSILDGQPYFNKNTGEVIYPAPGFNIIATANTKGRGSNDGKYLSQILDHAFLERFPITIEQENPPSDTQKKLLNIVLEQNDVPDDDFATKLVRWAANVRTAYKDEGSIDEQISTRRLVQICRTYGIFKDRGLAINLCIARFDSDIKKAFADFYMMVDENTTKIA